MERKKQMKAYLLKQSGNLTYTDTEKPSCGNNEVIVEVKAAGICGSDIARVYGTSAYFYPLIPGHEFSGIVSETGLNVNKSWLGKRVGVFPLIPCGKCTPCMEGKHELCRNYGYLGSRTAGGFAEYVAVPVWNLIDLPKSVSFEQAAMLEPMAVAAHAMRRAEIMKDQIVAICGIGTIGLLMYLLLKENGFKKILLIGNREYQKEMTEKLGFDTHYFCNIHKKNADEWLDENTGYGIDAFFECAGTSESVGLTLRHAAPEGLVMLVGNPPSDMHFDRQTYWKILRNQLTVKGSWNTSFTHKDTDDWHYCLDLISRRSVSPEKLISHRYPFDRLAEGLKLMRDKKEGYTKIMTSL